MRCTYVQGLGGLEIACRLWNTHEPAQLEPRQPRKRARQIGQRLWSNTGLVGAAVGVDLDAHLQRRQMRWTLLAQALRDLQTINRLDPVKMLGHQARLVALHGANAVPLNPCIAQHPDFFDRFLDVVLAQAWLPCGNGLFNRGYCKGLGYRQQRDRIHRPARCEAGGGYTGTNRLEIVRNHGHNWSVE